MRQLVTQLAEALALLEAMGLAHNDLKPDNVLVEEGQLPQLNIKLCDFGSVCSKEQALGLLTPQYMPPEVLRGTEEKGRAVDSWSLGVMLFEIVMMVPVWLCYTCIVQHQGYRALEHGALAVKGKNYKLILNRQADLIPKLTRRVKSSNLFGTSQDQFLGLMAGLLEPTAGKRLRAEQILAHPFVRV